MPDPKAENHFYHALDLLAQGKHDDGPRPLQTGHRNRPQFWRCHHGLSRAHQKTWHLDEAIEISERLSELDPDNILAQTGLSILCQKKGMIAQAEGHKARVLGWKQQLWEGKSGT